MNKRIRCITALVALVFAAMTLGYSQNIPITLNQGWNWISYPCLEPMSINEALAGFTPMPGDILRSQTDGSATYTNGRWRGSLTTLVPGKGYHYQSTDGTTRTFVFGGTANDPSALPEEALPGEFKVASNGTKVRFSPGNLQCRVDPSQKTQSIVGTGAETSYMMPYNTFYCYSLCQMIYTADELHNSGLSAGSITGMAFQSDSDLHYRRNGIQIWISNTSLTAAPTTSLSTSGMTQVFEGSLKQQTGWTEIAFATPWLWDGSSNMLVTVLMNHGSYESPYIYWQCSNSGFTCTCYARRDSNAYDPSSSTYSMSTSSLRPNTRFNGKGGAIWRFAERKWDVVGANNACVSSSYNGWIDLFGWGTNGHPHGANCYQQWSTSTTYSDYYAYGDASYNLYDQTGEADWGCNAISNGGDKPNQWRTLTQEEWDYKLNTRSGKRYAKAQVDGMNGLIVLPDGWQTSYYSLSNTNTASAAFTSNIISAGQWQTLEEHGAVFLPAAGYRLDANHVDNVGNYGIYWSSSIHDNTNSKDIAFTNTSLGTGYNDARYRGFSVRLVCQSNPRIRTIGMSNVTPTSAMANAEVDFTGTVGARGICWNTTGAPSYDDNHVSSGTGKGSFSKALTGLEPNTTYYVRAYAKISSVYRYGNTLTFTTPDDGSHEYVDLGLPSGLLWATCNIGADSPEDYGDYFAWGETRPMDYYDWSTYQYCNGNEITLTKYCDNSSYGYNGFTDNLTTLLPEDDAATANWGEGWRMPTYDEWVELLDNTTHTWATQNGVNGRIFTATNGNSLFLPAAGWRYGGSLYNAGSCGYYWWSSLTTDFPHYAWLFFYNSGDYDLDIVYRYYGLSVRAVRSGQN